MPCPFIITMGAVPLDYRVCQNPGTDEGGPGHPERGSYLRAFQPDLQERKHNWDMVLKAPDSGRTVVGMYHQVCLLSRVEECIAQRAFGSCRVACPGVDLTKDFYLQHRLWRRPCR